MVPISQIPANVTWVSGTAPRQVIAGATIVAGQPVVRNTTDLDYDLAGNDTDALSEFAGISIDGGVNERHMLIAPPGARVNFGATLTACTIYCLGNTPGEIIPEGDVAAGDFVVIICIGEGTAVATIIGAKGPVAHP